MSGMSSSNLEQDDRHVEKCLRGEALYGEDLDTEGQEAWLRDESMGYFGLVSTSENEYRYGYHALNRRHGYQHLPEKRFRSVLGVGSAFGEELAPIAERCSEITILEPAQGFEVDTLRGIRVRYVTPESGGAFPFSDAAFDLLTCLGVLHHLPNVTRVIQESYRCLEPGGFALMREPVVSMGDWRRPRVGLTKHERGIPEPLFREMVVTTGFEIVRERPCMFPLTGRLRYLFRQPVYNSRLAISIDNVLCGVRFWPKNYHPTRMWHKLRPACVFLVLRKPVDRKREAAGT